MKELPTGWTTAVLGDVTKVRKDKKDPRHLPDLPFIGLEEVEAHTGRIISVQDTSALKSAVTLFAEGEVLYGRLRPYLNKVVIPDFSGAASAEFIVFPRSEILEPRYLQRVLMSPDFVSFTTLKSTGDRPRISYESLSPYEFPVPPIGEQRRIVAKIDGLSTKSRRARDQLDHVPRLVEKYKRGVLKAAFGGELTAKWRKNNASSKAVGALPKRVRLQAERAIRKKQPKAYANTEGVSFPVLPQEWGYRSVHELYEAGWIIDYADGNHGSLYPTKADFSNDGILFITAEQIANGRVNFANAPRLKREKAAELKKGWSRQGDILLTHNATVGRVAIVDDNVKDFLLGTSVTFYRVDQEVIFPPFLYFALQSPIFQDQLAAVMVQTTRNQVPITTQALLRLPIPPDIGEQREIASRLGTAFRWIDRLAAEATSARKLIDHLDQAILAKAFRGKLVPQDPNDEPASVLLERIRAEQSAVVLVHGKKPKKARTLALKRH